MKNRRVVVTGMGIVSPLGHNLPDTWKAILAGKSGVQKITGYPVEDFPTKIWSNVKNFDPCDYIPAKDARKMDKFTQYGVVAAKEALRDSGLDIDEALALRTGVAVGAGIGGLHTITDTFDKMKGSGVRKISPFFIPTAIINMVAGHISITHGLKGPNISVVTACTTGTHNIGLGARLIAYGDADVMVCGGTETIESPLMVAGFSAVKALSRRNDEPEKASRPWDKDRDGFVVGEGAGILVLEEYEHAKARGAKIYAELLGFGMTGDAFHITSPDDEADGARRSMAEAVKDSGLSLNDVDYINAHGTSTYLNDKSENKAIKDLFGQHAYELSVSSTKSMTGHLLGAAGAVEAIFSVMAIYDNMVPPTINLDNPDEGCDLDYTPHHAKAREVRVALSNSFGFGGTNGTLVFGKVSE